MNYLFVVVDRKRSSAKLPRQASPGTVGMLEWLQALVSRMVALHLRREGLRVAGRMGKVSEDCYRVIATGARSRM